MAHESGNDTTAKQAFLLLNEASRQMVTASILFRYSENLKEQSPLPINLIPAIRHIIVTSLIVNIYRIHETREFFLCPFLFLDSELRELGFLPVKEFIGINGWKAFQTLRHQYAGHATAQKTPRTGERGYILEPARLGAAILQAGLDDLGTFITRLDNELVPTIERVRDEVETRYPGAKDYVMVHAAEVAKGLNRQWRPPSLSPSL